MNQQLRRGVAQLLFDLAAMQAPIQRHEDRAEFAAGKKHFVKMHAIMRQHRNAVTFAEVACPQNMRELIGPVIQLAVGETLHRPIVTSMKAIFSGV